MTLTQTERLIRFLRGNPGSTSLEITLACGIVNVTGRISDARALGYTVECKRRTDGRAAYWLNEQAQLRMAL
jgi:hypothetical protein